MEPSILIFLAASAVSYYPIYRLLCRSLLARGRMPASAGRQLPTASPRQQFLASLRLEAAARTRAIAREAARATETNASSLSAALDQGLVSRLDETAAMARALLSPQTATTFDEFVKVLRAPGPMASDRLDDLIRCLEQHLENAVSASPRRCEVRPDLTWHVVHGPSSVAHVATAGNAA